jgi:Domain of unknown function (DUF4124)
MTTTIGVLALALAGAAGAQVYKCTDENGRTIFSGMPCAPDAQDVTVKVRPADAHTANATQADLERFGREQRRSALEEAIRKHERTIRYHQDDMESEIAALRAKKGRAMNNLAGATWEESISNEMQAVARKHHALIEAEQREVQRLRDELKELQ